ncbi:UNVERIFIED_CONTAM: hypothetical protein QE602_10975, partial [Streptococcus suis]
LGCGIAGLGGVALSQLGNVGPDLGQGYIVDSFMVVVLGGVGQLAGTVIAAFGLGEVNKFLEPMAGAVLATLITRSIRGALGAEPDEVKQLALAVDRGELYHAAATSRAGDGGKRQSIMAALSEMSGNLRTTVTHVRDAATGVATISAQIAAGNLTAQLDLRKDDRASLMHSLMTMREQLAGLVG